MESIYRITYVKGCIHHEHDFKSEREAVNVFTYINEDYDDITKFDFEEIFVNPKTEEDEV